MCELLPGDFRYNECGMKQAGASNTIYNSQKPQGTEVIGPMDLWEILKLILYGLVEGITEWLPVSSTGHLILLEKFLPLQLSPEFLALFRIVIQLAAILAVVIYFWPQLWPIKRQTQHPSRARLHPLGSAWAWDLDILSLWGKILLACVPAGIVGLCLDEFFEKYFYNPLSVALALILVALVFLLVESRQTGQAPRIVHHRQITWQIALLIGCFQMLAGVFPGVSRSGACIIGGLLLGLSRPAASEFSFYLAIPVMAGASLLKLLRLPVSACSMELLALALACLVAFATSLLTIKYFLAYVRSHSFRGFAYYRIALGLVILLFLALP